MANGFKLITLTHRRNWHPYLYRNRCFFSSEIPILNFGLKTPDPELITPNCYIFSIVGIPISLSKLAITI
jgi:hypothetical protein